MSLKWHLSEDEPCYTCIVEVREGFEKMKTGFLKKPLIAGVVLAGTASILLPIAQAATSLTPQHNLQKAVFTLNGIKISEPYRFTFGGTTYVPVFYVQQMVNQALGIESKSDVWDGANHTWKISASGVTPKLITHGTGTMIYVNGTMVEQVPALVDVDPASGKSTTYMPVWYVQQLINQVLKLSSKSDVWNGSAMPATWSITTSTQSSDGTNPINAEVQKKAAAIYKQITWKTEGNYRVFTAPLFTTNTTSGVYVIDLTAYANKVLPGPGDPVEYSLDGGVTWHSVRYYDSFQTYFGGVKSAPKGVTHVMFREPKGDISRFELGWIGFKSNAGVGELRINPDGTKSMNLNVIGNLIG